jgi:hypothetical protein
MRSDDVSQATEGNVIWCAIVMRSQEKRLNAVGLELLNIGVDLLMLKLMTDARNAA